MEGGFPTTTRKRRRLGRVLEKGTMEHPRKRKRNKEEDEEGVDDVDFDL